MTGTIRKATILVAFGLLAAGTAMAGIPSPAHCTTPNWLDVVGTNGSVADPLGAFQVVVHDVSDLPIAGSTVTVDFAAATDIRLCTDIKPVGQTNTCNQASAITNISGVATFTIAGAAKDIGGLNYGGVLNSIVVYADGITIGHMSAAVFDLNGAAGSPGLSSLDGSALSTDNGLYGGVGNALYKARCDYTHDGFQSSLDASYMSTRRGLGTSAVGCGTYCP